MYRSERERYINRGRRFDDEPTPFVGKLILALAGFTMAGMIIVLALP